MTALQLDLFDHVAQAYAQPRSGRLTQFEGYELALNSIRRDKDASYGIVN